MGKMTGGLANRIIMAVQTNYGGRFRAVQMLLDAECITIDDENALRKTLGIAYANREYALLDPHTTKEDLRVINEEVAALCLACGILDLRHMAKGKLRL